jgi:hypothetical protein
VCRRSESCRGHHCFTRENGCTARILASWPDQVDDRQHPGLTPVYRCLWHGSGTTVARRSARNTVATATRSPRPSPRSCDASTPDAPQHARQSPAVSQTAPGRPRPRCGDLLPSHGPPPPPRPLRHANQRTELGFPRNRGGFGYAASGWRAAVSKLIGDPTHPATTTGQRITCIS